MTTGTRVTVLSPEYKAETHEQIVAQMVRALFRRYHTNRDWIIGLVGERGSGKSLGGANIAIRDFAMNCEPLWSNMDIQLGVYLPREATAPYGLDEGLALYKAEYIEKQKFLSLDDYYSGGCLMLDEFNIEYGEARRSSSNVNLKTDTAIQQLRKLQDGLIYTGINEMYMDVRIRENTDIFIRCSDVAYKPENLRAKMKPGIQFEWLIYPMTAKVFGAGKTYADTGKPIGPIQITLGSFWGVIDTYERQVRESGSMKETLLPIQIKEDEAERAKKDYWTPLYASLDKFWANHAADGDYIEITSEDFRVELGIPRENWAQIVRQLQGHFEGNGGPIIPDMERRGQRNRHGKFIIKNRVLI